MSTKASMGLDQLVRQDHTVLPLKRGKEEEQREMPPPAKDRTSLPNYVITIVVGLVVPMLAFVAQNFYWKGQIDERIDNIKTTMSVMYQKQIDSLESRLLRQETYMKNSRELLIANGWDVSEEGLITKRRK